MLTQNNISNGDSSGLGATFNENLVYIGLILLTLIIQAAGTARR